MRTSSQTQVPCVRVHSWSNWPPQIKEVICSHERSACDLAWSPSLLEYPPGLPLCAAMSLPLPIWEIRGHLVSKMCHTAIYTCEWTGKQSLTLMSRPCPGHRYVLAVIWDAEIRLWKQNGVWIQPWHGVFSEFWTVLKQIWGDYKVHVIDCDYDYLRISWLRLCLRLQYLFM